MEHAQLLPHIRQSIEGITPVDELEHTHQRDALAWVASGAPLFRVKKPDIPPKHLVAYFALIDPEHQSILLEDHIKSQLWLPPGGHVEPGEDPRDTVRREGREELTISTTFLHNYDRPLFVTVTQTVGLTPGHTDVSLWYLVRGSVHDFYVFDKGELNDVQWFSFAEILASDPVIFDPHMQRFTRKLQAHLGK